jgi:hypothetical protein
MLEFLTVTALVLLLVVGAVITIGVLALRALLRSRLVTTGRELLADGVTAVAACRPGPIAHRAAALRALRISHAHRRLRQRVTEAERLGIHLGDVPTVLPRLEAEGRRIRVGLGRLVDGGADGGDLVARADRHLATLADLGDAVGAATSVPAADDSLARDVEEAALGLRLHAAAYRELMAPGAS